MKIFVEGGIMYIIINSYRDGNRNKENKEKQINGDMEIEGLVLYYDFSQINILIFIYSFEPGFYILQNQLSSISVHSYSLLVNNGAQCNIRCRSQLVRSNPWLRTVQQSSLEHRLHFIIRRINWSRIEIIHIFCDISRDLYTATFQYLNKVNYLRGFQ